MQYYRSKTYESFAVGSYATNTFLVLSDNERLSLEDKINQLEEDMVINPYKKKFNKKDAEAIVFLKRMCWFRTYECSVAIDPTSYQIATIVEKLLFKVYNPHNGQFINWLRLWVDTEKMTPEDMRNHMQRKRDIAHTLKDEGLLPATFNLPY